MLDFSSTSSKMKRHTSSAFPWKSHSTRTNTDYFVYYYSYSDALRNWNKFYKFFTNLTICCGNSPRSFTVLFYAVGIMRLNEVLFSRSFFELRNLKKLRHHYLVHIYYGIFEINLIYLFKFNCLYTHFVYAILNDIRLSLGLFEIHTAVRIWNLNIEWYRIFRPCFLHAFRIIFCLLVDKYEKNYRSNQ